MNKDQYGFILIKNNNQFLIEVVMLIHLFGF